MITVWNYNIKIYSLINVSFVYKETHKFINNK
jgi:hypothetical protein